MNDPTATERKIKEGFIGQKMVVLPPNKKKSFQKSQLIKNFYVTAIGYYPHARYHNRERKNGSVEYILLYCTEGKGQIEVGNRKYDLAPNTFFIVPRGIFHRYQSLRDDPWSIYWMHFAGDLSDVLYSKYDQSGVPEICSIPYDEKRIENFDQLYAILETSFEEREMEIFNIKAFEFVSSLIYYKETNPSFFDKDSISHSIDFMKKNIHKSFTIEELARQQKFSISYYSKLFKAKTGSSPIQYFNELKIQKSCQYLYFTDNSIKEISAELGMNDPYYFSRLFKNFMGISPEKYRKAHKK